MNYFLLTHTHKHGMDTYQFKALDDYTGHWNADNEHEISDISNVLTQLHIDFEPNLNEFIDIESSNREFILVSRGFKTTLPEAIETVSQAKTFLKELHINGESFHPEDDPEDVTWGPGLRPSKEENDHVRKLMEQVCSFSEFNPYDYIRKLL